MQNNHLFHNMSRAKQLIDFSEIRIGKTIIPTDIDCFVEYHNKAYILGEYKYKKYAHKDPELNYGQSTAITIAASDLRMCGKDILLFIATHDTHDTNELVNGADSKVWTYKWNETWECPVDLTVIDLINKFIEEIDDNE